MNKPPVEVYDRFSRRFYALSKEAGKKQYLVPYLMSSHPGSTLKDAVYLAEYLCKNNIRPEQVQDFYPTPGTVSTCMFYTGLDPYTLKPVYVARTSEEKSLQRALLQYYLPQNAQRVREALAQCGREDLLPVLLSGARGSRAAAPAAHSAENGARGHCGGRSASAGGEHRGGEHPTAAAGGRKTSVGGARGTSAGGRGVSSGSGGAFAGGRHAPAGPAQQGAHGTDGARRQNYTRSGTENTGAAPRGRGASTWHKGAAPTTAHTSASAAGARKKKR